MCTHPGTEEEIHGLDDCEVERVAVEWGRVGDLPPSQLSMVASSFQEAVYAAMKGDLQGMAGKV